MEIKASAGEFACLMEEINRLSPVNIESILEVTDDEPERTTGQEGGFPHVHMTSDGGIFINGHRMEAVTNMIVKPAFRSDCHTVTLEFETPYIELENGELPRRKS